MGGIGLQNATIFVYYNIYMARYFEKKKKWAWLKIPSSPSLYPHYFQIPIPFYFKTIYSFCYHYFCRDTLDSSFHVLSSRYRTLWMVMEEAGGVESGQVRSSIIDVLGMPPRVNKFFFFCS